METMLKFRCDGCDKEFIVMDHQVDTDTLTCPRCQASATRMTRSARPPGSTRVSSCSFSTNTT